MSTRLPYETKGGNFSPAETITQMTEYARLMSECAYSLSHHYKANGDDFRADGLRRIGQNMEKMAQYVIQLSTGKVSN
jgi:hypothetical protein